MVVLSGSVAVVVEVVAAVSGGARPSVEEEGAGPSSMLPLTWEASLHLVLHNLQFRLRKEAKSLKSACHCLNSECCCLSIVAQANRTLIVHSPSCMYLEAILSFRSLRNVGMRRFRRGEVDVRVPWIMQMVQKV